MRPKVWIIEELDGDKSYNPPRYVSTFDPADPLNCVRLTFNHGTAIWFMEKWLKHAKKAAVLMARLLNLFTGRKYREVGIYIETCNDEED